MTGHRRLDLALEAEPLTARRKRGVGNIDAVLVIPAKAGVLSLSLL